MGVAKETEESFQNTVIQVARLAAKWDVYHNPDSRRSCAGFLDLTFRRDARYAICVFVAELKVEPNKPTPAQLLWLESWRAMRIPAYLWYPRDWDVIELVLFNNELRAANVPPQVVTSPPGVSRVKGRTVRTKREELPEWL